MSGFYERKHSLSQRLKKPSSPCGAGVAHSLGKGEATSSNLVMGIFDMYNKIKLHIKQTNNRTLKSKIWVDARVSEGAKEKS